MNINLKSYGWANLTKETSEASKEEITPVVMPTPAPLVKFESRKNKNRNRTVERFGCKLSKISYDGNATVEFNVSMWDQSQGFNLSYLNTDTMNVSLQIS